MRSLSRAIVVLATTLCIANVGVAQQPCKSTVVGDLRIEQFQSKIFDRMITVRVWLPSGYTDVSQTSKKYPTLYMLDGQNAFDQCTAFKGERALQLDETITRLIAEHKIAPMIVVGVDSAHGEGRDQEYERFAMSLSDRVHSGASSFLLASSLACNFASFCASSFLLRTRDSKRSSTDPRKTFCNTSWRAWESADS
jgi:Putative esterase